MSERELNAKIVEAIKGDGDRQEIWDTACTGLVLMVSATGAKTWQARYRFNGERRKKSLGPADVVSLADAREKVKAIRRDVTEGRDPEAVAIVAADTVAEIEKRRVKTLWESFEKRGFKKGKATKKTRAKWGAFYKKQLTAWHDRDAATITKHECLAVVEAAEKRGPNAGNFAVTVLKSFFNWIAGRGLIEESPMFGVAKPAAESDNERERFLNDAELAAVWAGCDKLKNPVFGLWFKMLFATGQRRDEVADMTWAEVDLAARVWTLPGALTERTKNKKPHSIYLNDAAMAILQAVPRYDDCPFVFSTNGKTPISGFSKAKAALDKESGVTGWRPHDARRTMATNTQRLRIDREVIEACQNRSLTGTKKRYQRHDYTAEKRAAFIRWNGLLTRIIAGDPKAVAAFVATFQPPEALEPAEGANVVQMVRPAAQ
jgi:integrase